MKEVIAAYGKSCEFAKALSSRLSKKFVELNLSHFADSESYIKRIDLFAEKIFIPNKFSFSKSINSQLLDFLFLLSVLKKNGLRNITVFLPYLPYSRQDKCFNFDGLGLVETVIDFLRIVGANRLVTCELHNPEIISKLNLSVENIDFSPFWLAFLKKTKYLNLIDGDLCQVCFVAPDYGAKLRNQSLADNLGANFAFIKKVRVGPDSPVVLEIHGDDIKNKIVIMVDDIIDTGKTAANAADFLFRCGARKVIGCFTHAVLSRGSIERIEKSSFESVFISDTVFIDKDFLGEKFFVVSSDNFLLDHFSSFIFL